MDREGGGGGGQMRARQGGRVTGVGVGGIAEEDRLEGREFLREYL